MKRKGLIRGRQAVPMHVLVHHQLLGDYSEGIAGCYVVLNIHCTPGGSMKGMSCSPGTANGVGNWVHYVCISPVQHAESLPPLLLLLLFLISIMPMFGNSRKSINNSVYLRRRRKRAIQDEKERAKEMGASKQRTTTTLLHFTY